MYPLLVVLVVIHALLLLSNNHVESQVVPRCVPKGLCFPQTPDINPRIVTPGEGGGNITACTAGFELCYPYDGTFACGTRYVEGITNNNGPTQKGSHPWQVYLVNQTNKYMGSGILLTDRHILTAAHKVYLNLDTPNNIKIYLGVNNPTGISQPPAALRTASNIIIHSDFKTDNLDYKDDIALILMDKPYSMGYRVDLGIGCLPRSTDSFVGDECMVAGWGETQFKSHDEGTTHKQVSVPIVSMATCKASMDRPNVLGPTTTAKYLDTEKELCAGGENNEDACTQDGGAPLMCLHKVTKRYVVAGLVIWGKGCGKKDVYGVYVDVTKYTDWINEGISSLN